MNKMKFYKILLIFAISVCTLIFVSSIVLAVYFKESAFFSKGVPFFVYCVLLIALYSKEKELEKHKTVDPFLIFTIKEMGKDLKRYEEKYGKLPEEEKKEEEPNEEKKEE